MKRCVESQNFCRLSERPVSPGGLDTEDAVLQKLLSWVYWLYVFQSSCQLLPPAFILFFLFFTLVFFRHPPKPSYICLAFKLQGHELLSAGDLGCAWNMWVLSTSGGSVSLVSGTLTGSFPTQVPVCLEARGMAQAFSSCASMRHWQTCSY